MPEEWYKLTTDSTLEQGDIVSNCKIYSPIYPNTVDGPVTELAFDIFEVIVMSQTCDLVIDREKITHVVLCPVAMYEDIEKDGKHPLSQKGRLKVAAQNKEPAFFVLDKFEHASLGRGFSIVHFRQVYTLPLEFFRKVAEQRGQRLRLRSPYKEALASRFAAFFGRVALPKDLEV